MNFHKKQLLTLNFDLLKRPWIYVPKRHRYGSIVSLRRGSGDLPCSSTPERVIMSLFRVAIAMALSALFCYGQESRGTILGRVLDSSGAVVPGANVHAKNVATNTVVSSVANEAGNYEMPYLVPGTYQVTAELSGFKTAVRDGIQIRINDRLVLDFTLEVGNVTESVVVRGETPLLESARASMGSIVDQHRVTELPVKGGNPLYLIRSAPGVGPTSRGNGQNPFDRGVSNITNVNGTKGASNEVRLDGVTNQSGTYVSYSPQADLVQEYKIHTAGYDAALGHAAGAIFDISIKSGTNTPHGTAYYFDSRIQANLWFANKWLYDPKTGPITDEKRAKANPGRMNQRLGFTFTGPVYLPRLYDGRNKTFFSYGWEPRVYESIPGTFTGTVPTEAERQGDFSGLLKLGSQYQIYDPATIAPAATAGRFSRQPLPGNIVPASRINPIAKELLKYWSMPNAAGTADSRQNYFRNRPTTQGPWSSHLVRIDQNFTERHRMFFRFNTFGMYFGHNYNMPTIAFGDRNPVRGYGGLIDDVLVLTPQLLLDLRYGVNYHRNVLQRNSQGFDLLSLGLPQNLVGEIRTRSNPAGIAFPLVSVDGGAFTNLGADGGSAQRTFYQTLSGTATRITGNHSIRAGGEFRVNRETGNSFGNVAPRLDFSCTWTRGPVDNSPCAPIGQGMASMLLGLPSGGQIDINATRAQQSTFTAAFVHDDWRVTPRLTLNLGLRYEYEGAITERFNRSVRGFDFQTPSPVEQQVRAQYALAPIPEIAPSAFRVLGGLTFAGANGQPRALWNPDKNNVAPRVGLAFRIARQTVMRAGYGIFYDPQGVERQSVFQTGFSQSTSLIPSRDNGLSFRATLSNPFPDGLLMPAGASGGLGTFLGRGVTYFNERMPNPYMQRWSLSLQQQLPQRFVLEAAYVGNRGTKLAATRTLNPTPRQYLSTSPVRDQTTIDYLSTQVKNPFAGIPEFAGTGLGGANVARSALLVSNPQFTGISVKMPTGFTWYHSLQVSAVRRFANGFTLNSAWTWAKWMEAVSYLNATDSIPEKVISNQNYPHRFVVNAIYQLPIGRGKRLFTNARGLLNQVIGGWQIESTYESRSGNPLGFGNVIFYGDLKNIPLPVAQRSVERWFNTNAGFERDSRKQLGSNIRTFSSRFNNVRGAGLNYFDSALTRHFAIREGMRAEFRFEAYNTLNHVQFGNPNMSPTSTAFGTVTSELSDGQRQLYFGLKFVF